ncbi:aminotransferase-like domain-containing protein [Dermacoccus abyssi]
MVDRVNPSRLCSLLGDVNDPSDLPSYRKLAEGVRSLTMAGRLPVGAQLPSERVLAEQLRISRTTVASAYRLLAQSGVIETSHGRRATLRVPPGSANDLLRSCDDDVLDLVSGVPMPPDALLESTYRRAAARLPQFFGSTSLPPQGLSELRERVARRYVERGLPTSPEEILITAGAEDGLRQVFDSLLRRGDTVLVEQPGYQKATTMLARDERRLVPLELAAQRTDVWNDQDIATAFAHHRPRAFYTTPDGHNPTGGVMGASTREVVGRWAMRTRCLLVIDETTAELAAQASLPLAAHVEDPRLAVSIGSLSKVFWPGMRVGWVRAPAETIATICVAPNARDVTGSVIDQLAAASVLEDIDRVRRLRMDQISESRTVAIEALSRYLPDAVCVPRKGFTLWVRMPVPIALSARSEVALAGVRVGLGPQFGLGDAAYVDHFRIPLVQAPHVLEEAIRRLATVWDPARSRRLDRLGHQTNEASATYTTSPEPMESSELRVRQ